MWMNMCKMHKIDDNVDALILLIETQLSWIGIEFNITKLNLI